MNLVSRLKASTRQSREALYKNKYGNYGKYKGKEYYGFSLPELYMLYTNPLEIDEGDKIVTLDLYSSLIELLGENNQELLKYFLRGLAYNLTEELVKEETPLNKSSLLSMLEIIDPYVSITNNRPKDFRMNNSVSFSQALTNLNYKTSEVNLVSVPEFRGDLNDLSIALAKRVNELQGGLDYIEYIINEREKKKVSKKELKEISENAESTKEKVFLALDESATVVADAAWEIKQGTDSEKWHLLDYLEYYRGEHEPMEKFYNKFLALSDSFMKEYKVDLEVTTIGKDVKEISIERIERLKNNLGQAMIKENHKLSYVNYLIEKGSYSKDEYFSKLA